MADYSSGISNYSTSVNGDYDKYNFPKDKKAQQNCCQDKQVFNADNKKPELYEKKPDGGFCACC